MEFSGRSNGNVVLWWQRGDLLVTYHSSWSNISHVCNTTFTFFLFFSYWTWALSLETGKKFFNIYICKISIHELTRNIQVWRYRKEHLAIRKWIRAPFRSSNCDCRTTECTDSRVECGILSRGPWCFACKAVNGGLNQKIERAKTRNKMWCKSQLVYGVGGGTGERNKKKARSEYYGPPTTPVATATFSPNGNWGDFTSAGSFTVGV